MFQKFSILQSSTALVFTLAFSVKYSKNFSFLVIKKICQNIRIFKTSEKLRKNECHKLKNVKRGCILLNAKDCLLNQLLYFSCLRVYANCLLYNCLISLCFLQVDLDCLSDDCNCSQLIKFLLVCSLIRIVCRMIVIVCQLILFVFLLGMVCHVFFIQINII